MFIFKIVVCMVRLWFCGYLYMIVYFLKLFKVIVFVILFKDLIYIVCEGCGIKIKWCIRLYWICWYCNNVFIIGFKLLIFDF